MVSKLLERIKELEEINKLIEEIKSKIDRDKLWRAIDVVEEKIKACICKKVPREILSVDISSYGQICFNIKHIAPDLDVVDKQVICSSQTIDTEKVKEEIMRAIEEDILSEILLIIKAIIRNFYYEYDRLIEAKKKLEKHLIAK